jgi:hypothetical protein
VQHACGGSQHGEPGKQHELVFAEVKAQPAPPAATTAIKQMAKILVRMTTNLPNFRECEKSNQLKKTSQISLAGAINTAKHNS